MCETIKPPIDRTSGIYIFSKCSRRSIVPVPALLFPCRRSHLGVTLSKSCQKSPWGRRPLEQAQLKYAACDALGGFLKSKTRGPGQAAALHRRSTNTGTWVCKQWHEPIGVFYHRNHEDSAPSIHFISREYDLLDHISCALPPPHPHPPSIQL